jgi:hypothetical protein
VFVLSRIRVFKGNLEAQRNNKLLECSLNDILFS